MKEFNLAMKDAAKAEAIRRQYVGRGVSKMDQLQSLDSKVKLPGTIVSSIPFTRALLAAAKRNTLSRL